MVLGPVVVVLVVLVLHMAEFDHRAISELPDFVARMKLAAKRPKKRMATFNGRCRATLQLGIRATKEQTRKIGVLYSLPQPPKQRIRFATAERAAEHGLEMRQINELLLSWVGIGRVKYRYPAVDLCEQRSTLLCWPRLPFGPQ